MIDLLTSLGYSTFIRASLGASNASTGVLKSAEEGAMELGDSERARKQCFLYMHPRNIFLGPQGFLIVLLPVFTVSS